MNYCSSYSEWWRANLPLFLEWQSARTEMRDSSLVEVIRNLSVRNIEFQHFFIVFWPQQKNVTSHNSWISPSYCKGLSPQFASPNCFAWIRFTQTYKPIPTLHDRNRGKCAGRAQTPSCQLQDQKRNGLVGNADIPDASNPSAAFIQLQENAAHVAFW